MRDEYIWKPGELIFNSSRCVPFQDSTYEFWERFGNAPRETNKVLEIYRWEIKDLMGQLALKPDEYNMYYSWHRFVEIFDSEWTPMESSRVLDALFSPVIQVKWADAEPEKWSGLTVAPPNKFLEGCFLIGCDPYQEPPEVINSTGMVIRKKMTVEEAEQYVKDLHGDRYVWRLCGDDEEHEINEDDNLE